MTSACLICLLFLLCVCLEEKRPVVTPCCVGPLGQVSRPESVCAEAAEIGWLGVQSFLCRTQEPESYEEV